MDHEREALWESTARCHNDIQGCVFELRDIAARVDYLHPKLADELVLLAKDIEHARQTIQNNAAGVINIDIRHGEAQMGNLLSALINSASK